MSTCVKCLELAQGVPEPCGLSGDGEGWSAVGMDCNSLGIETSPVSWSQQGRVKAQPSRLHQRIAGSVSGEWLDGGKEFSRRPEVGRLGWNW